MSDCVFCMIDAHICLGCGEPVHHGVEFCISDCRSDYLRGRGVARPCTAMGCWQPVCLMSGEHCWEHFQVSPEPEPSAVPGDE